MKKYGLVLAGGGAKGAYQLGAWQAMKELGIIFSAVVGVSIGSINGALIAADSFDEAKTLWKSASVDKGVKITEELRDPENLFSFRNFPALFKEIVRNGGIDASPTKELVARFVDEEKARKSDVKFGMVTYYLSEFTPLEIFIDKIPEGQLVDYLLASSKVPGVSKIGPEGERYLDGGVYDNAPMNMLIRNGYNRMIVVDISSIKGIGHKNDITCAEMIYIRPYDIEDLGAAFDFSEEMFEKRMKMGYLDARKAFGYLSGIRYYFEGDTMREMTEEYGADAFEELEELAFELEVERFKVYTKDEFLFTLKKSFDEYKAQEEARETEEEPRFYDNILKRITRFRSEKDYSQAFAVLDNIVY
ncbi:MAG: patatin-like phospholipase family protein [Clostridia bacterium]|nr:patatin-like phospholipase family protein [Clostridia bacterium]